MKIIRRPITTEVLNRSIECSECGTVFKISKRDITKGYIATYKDTENNKVVAVRCPCCNNYSRVNDVETAEERAYNSVVGMLQGIAQDVKDIPNKEVRAQVATIVDDLYNQVYDKLEEIHEANKA